MNYTNYYEKTFQESSWFQGLLMKTAPWTVRIPSTFLDVTAFLNSINTQKKKKGKWQEKIIHA